MKVIIGKYKNWIGPYQIADSLQWLGWSEDKCHLIGEYFLEDFTTETVTYIEININ